MSLHSSRETTSSRASALFPAGARAAATDPRGCPLRRLLCGGRRTSAGASVRPCAGPFESGRVVWLDGLVRASECFLSLLHRFFGIQVHQKLEILLDRGERAIGGLLPGSFRTGCCRTCNHPAGRRVHKTFLCRRLTGIESGRRR